MPGEPPSTDALRAGLHRPGQLMEAPEVSDDRVVVHPLDAGFGASIELDYMIAERARVASVGLSHASSGIMAIATERARQLTSPHLGFTQTFDSQQHLLGELGMAAACYAAPVGIWRLDPSTGGIAFVDPFPWKNGDWDKRAERPTGGGYVVPGGTSEELVDEDDVVVTIAQRKRELEKAGALIAAEWDRIDLMERRLREDAEHVERMEPWLRTALESLIATGAFAVLSNDEAAAVTREAARRDNQELEEADIMLGIEALRARACAGMEPEIEEIE